MMRSRTLRGAARLLLGTLVAAYAMVSLQVDARVTRAPGMPPALAQDMAASHCHDAVAETPVADPGTLLCKHHCQSEVQTLDHPVAKVAASADTGWLAVPQADDARGTCGPAAPRARPQATHHGGAPPPFLATLRLRI